MFTDLEVSRWQHVTAAGGGGYTIDVRIRVFRPDGAAALTQTIPASDLSWSWDGTSTLPASGQITVPAIDWSDPAAPIDYRPTDTSSALAPFGNGITVDVAVDDGLNPKQWMRLGVGLISQVGYARPAETLDVQIADLGTVFVQALTTVDWSVTAPTPVKDIVGLVFDAAYLPAHPTIKDPGGVLNQTFSQVVTWPPGTPLWEILQTVVSAADPTIRAWFDRDGQLCLSALSVDTAAPPDLTTKPSRVLKTGTGGHITELQTVLSRLDAVNLVAVAVEDTEVVDPTYATITGTESDMAETLRKKVEDVAGTGTGFGKKVTQPGGRRGGFTNKQPTRPRWPFMDTAAHPMGATFGQHGSVWWNNTHYGTDFSAPNGGTVVAVAQGRIVHVGTGPEGWAGIYVVQQASDGSRFYYCHLASTAVRVGDFVLRQTPIGEAGDTGKAFGKHLHLERRKSPYQMPGSCVDWRGGGDVK